MNGKHILIWKLKASRRSTDKFFKKKKKLEILEADCELKKVSEAKNCQFLIPPPSAAPPPYFLPGLLFHTGLLPLLSSRLC